MIPYPTPEILGSLINNEELYQNAPCGYLTMLPDSTIININTTLLNWLGFTKEEIYQKKFSDILSKGGKIHYEMFFMPMIKVSGLVKELSYELICKNGTFFPALLNVTVIKDSNGILTAYHIAVIDITHRKQYETQLIIAKKNADAEKTRFELLANLSPEIIWSANTNGIIDYINPRFSKYFNVLFSELSVTGMLSKIHESDRKNFLKYWITSMRTGLEHEFKCRLQNGLDNSYEWFRIKIISYKNETDQNTKLVGWCENINEHVMAMQRKDEFIHIASHELNTPITILKAYLQLMELSKLPEDVKMYIKRGLSSVKNLQFLISSLLDVSVINSGKLTLNISRFSLTTMIQDCIEQLNSSKKISHTIVLRKDSDDYFVRADNERLHQVIINLITNGVKYSPGAKSVIVQLSKNKNLQTVSIEISDFGMGIPADQLALIFDKYYRVSEQGKKTGISGLGLGLYITNNIIQAHQSELLVKSAVGAGSTFYFSLPLDEENE
ncbi:MAG: ATP-binding protein [Bacteroidota bacterium]|nr:ATP-binding protein [Bacteroidota bacterium]